MAEKKNYTGIDCFRLLAAVFVVAIHTSPLGSFSVAGDFLLTRVLARVAVPFFFMTSGFFLISRYTPNTQKLAVFVKKTSIIYAGAILLCLPIQIYNGYFRQEQLFPRLIKDIVFDGTLYHLWYLPASITGAIMAWYLVKRLNYSKALAIASVLYLIGLFGDSYYGISERAPYLKEFYGQLFQVSEYTRNGIFFAPVFFLLGGKIAEMYKSPSRKEQAQGISTAKVFQKHIIGFVFSFALMLAEAMLLHALGLCRHDSMYVFLLPCMYFLFQILLQFQGKCRKELRTISLLIYIIHPVMIVVIRLFAKITHLQKILVDNSLVHFLMVLAASVIFSWIVTLLWKQCRPKKTKQTDGTDRTYLEINLKNLEHNVKVLKSGMQPGCELMAVVKARAYGHGMYETAVYLNRIGVRAYAVATIEEGIALRRYGILGEILILGYTAPERGRELCKYDLTQTLIDYVYAKSLNRQGYQLKAHLKVDTGMHRLGFAQEDIGEMAKVFSMKHMKITGIYTHLCAADSMDASDISFTQKQIEGFYGVLKELRQQGFTIPKTHIQSSYGLLNYPKLQCDYVRAGISLYGVLSSPHDSTRLNLKLRPVLSWRTRIILLRKVKAGESVGYGRAFVAERDSTIAILPVGYADGYPRNLSCGKSAVLICGQWAPIVGRVCMDQMAVDVTGISHVRVGMMATLIGRDKEEEITASEVADNAGSITNELLSRMGQRVQVICRA